MVDVTRGANAPLIMSTITTQLEKENKVLKGEAKRKPVIIIRLMFFSYKKKFNQMNFCKIFRLKILTLKK